MNRISKALRFCGVVCLSALIAACGGGGGGGGGGSSNQPPAFSGPTSFTFAETDGVDFTLTVTDPDSTTVTIRGINGGDSALFIVDAASGRITANTATGTFDFENPLDSNSDNVYTQDLELSDGVNTVTDTITVTITNVDEPPEFPQGGEIALNENATGTVFTFTAVDPEGAAVSGYRIAEVVKVGEVVNAQRLLDAFAVDPVTGELSVVVPFDTEVEGTQDVITVSVEATDGLNVGLGGVNLRLVDLPATVGPGLRISGRRDQNPLGAAANAIGDVDNDGIPDFWVSEDNGEASEEIGYVLWGATIRGRLGDPAGNDVLVSDLSPTERLTIVGGDPATTTRRNVLTGIPAGDVDNDGFDDLLLLLRERRDFTQIEEVDNGPIAVLLYGQALASRGDNALALDLITAADGVTLTGLPRRDAARLTGTAADFDGDDRDDLVLGLGDNNRALVVFGDALVASGGEVNLAIAGNSAVVTVRSEILDRNIIQQTGAAVTVIDDITSDGLPELVVSGEQLEPAFESGVFVIDGALIAGAKGTADTINVSDPANDAQVVEMTTPEATVDSLAADGDGDNDGRADLLIGHTGNLDNKRIATVVYGSRLASLLGTVDDPSLDATAATDGLAISDSGSDPDLVGGPVAVRWLPNAGGAGGSEVALGLGSASPLGRSSAGLILVVPDSALVTAASPALLLDSSAPDPSLVTALAGYATLGRTGLALFVADVDGDGLAEFGTASLTSGDGPPDPQVGGIVFGAGTVLADALAQVDGLVDLADVLVVEAP